MDPDAALNDIITSILNGEYGEARAILADLEEWTNRGGFKPRDPRA